MPGLLSSNGDGTETPQGSGKDIKDNSSPDDINAFLSDDSDDNKDEVVEEKDEKDDDKDEEEERPRKKAKTKDKEDDDDEDEKDEDDDDLELKDDEDEEKLKLDEDNKDEMEIDSPPRKKDILSKYPKFFKEFPFMEKMMYRDRQYTELFGSYDDAKEAAERVQVLSRFEDDLSAGNTSTILKQIKELDKKAYDKIVDNYIEVLGTFDKEAQSEVLSTVGKNFIAAMVRDAKKIGESNKEGSEALRQAALVLNQFLFGSDEYTPPKARVQKSEAEDTVKAEQQQYTRQRFEDAQNELQSKTDNILRATINEYIDRNGEMSKFVKKHAVAGALKALHKSIGSDTNFRKSLDRLWEAAYNDRFSRSSLDRIKSAYLGRSKQALKTVIKNARAEALKDAVPSRRVNDEDEQEETRPRRTTTSGRPRQSQGGNKDKREKGESVLEFFSR